MGDLVRDGLLLAVRRPLLVVVLPIMVMVGTAWLATFLLGAGYGFEKTESAPWVRPDTVAAMPLLAMIWVALAWDRQTEPDDQRERIRRALGGMVVGTILCLAFLLMTEWTYVGGVLVGLLMPLVSVVVNEPGWFGKALTRSFALAKGSRWQILLAWALLELIVLAFGLVVWVIAVVQTEERILYELIYDVALRMHAGLRWGLTMAIGVAAYRRLRVSRAALDVDAWVEVFR